jgi:hypothetical protein
MSMASERVKVLVVAAVLAAVAVTVPHTNSFLILLATRACRCNFPSSWRRPATASL